LKQKANLTTISRQCRDPVIQLGQKWRSRFFHSPQRLITTHWKVPSKGFALFPWHQSEAVWTFAISAWLFYYCSTSQRACTSSLTSMVDAYILPTALPVILSFRQLAALLSVTTLFHLQPMKHEIVCQHNFRLQCHWIFCQVLKILFFQTCDWAVGDRHRIIVASFQVQ